MKFVSTLAPAWVADHNPVYGGFFWINGDGSYPVSRSAYFMSGAGGQKTMIIPSHDLVVPAARPADRNPRASACEPYQEAVERGLSQVRSPLRAIQVPAAVARVPGT